MLASSKLLPSPGLKEHLLIYVVFSLAYAQLVVLIARLFYNLKVSRPSDFQGLVEREHFTVSYAPRGCKLNFEAI